MTTLAQLSRQLDNALRAFAIELAKGQGETSYEFHAYIEKSSYSNAAKIGYTLAQDYEAKTKGNDAGAVLTEWRRRQGWNEAHEPMVLIEAPKAEAGSSEGSGFKPSPLPFSDGSRPDDDIPF